jgi:ferric-dicitrate binding protein FerR (iron transport regulator)
MDRRRAGAADGEELVSEVDRNASIVTEEQETVRLLRAAGPRVAVSTERAARVRSAVRGAWQAHGRRRAVRRRLLVASALVGVAALLVVAMRVAIVDHNVAPLGALTAIVEAVDGSVSGLQRADSVHVGQWIETRQGARVALRIGGDTSVRIDVDSRLRMLSSSVIELASGAVYLDTGREDGSVEIRTPLGTARDLGTQFEVRLTEHSLRLRVRTGVVELSDRTRSISARTGTEITLTPTDAVTRSIAPHSSEWAWVSRVSPPLHMNGVPLAAFLARVAREQGWTVEYDDAALAGEAERIILHGSASELAPSDAAEVAITTSGLRYRLEGGTLVVLRSEPTQPAEPGNRP